MNAKSMAAMCNPRFSLGQNIWFFHPDTEKISQAQVESILINSDGTFYALAELNISLPEKQLFANREACLLHFRNIFK